MSKTLEEIASELQKKIMEEIKKKYSETVIEHWQNPRNLKKIENPDGYGKVKGPCGDTMEIFLKIENDKIVDCGFLTDGCGTTISCGSMVTELAKGKNILGALTITQEKLLKALGGLPEADQHCALLATSTLRKALSDYLYKKREPWRKFYRNI